MVPRSSCPFRNRCNRSYLFPLVAFVVCTILAQVVLTLRSAVRFITQRLEVDSGESYHRIYAVTSKSVPIALVFATITISQFCLGLLMFLQTRNTGKTCFVEQRLPSFNSHLCDVVSSSSPFMLYQLCTFVPKNPITEVAYTGISLFFGAYKLSET
jgi:hypothetical protein